MHGNPNGAAIWDGTPRYSPAGLLQRLTRPVPEVT